MFYLLQYLDSQGEDSIHSHKIGTKVALKEVPFIMRALGFYPTEKEVDDLINEVKFSRFVTTGEYVDEIGFEELIQSKYSLYLSTCLSIHPHLITFFL